MPRALAIETSSRVGSIAVVDDDRVLAEEQFEHGLQHAALIIPIVDRLTRAQGWSPRDIEHFYVSAGPGSFTGLRIGVTMAKTMALAGGVKLVAVPTTRVLVVNAPPDARHVIIVLDAKRDQIFTARFSLSPSPRRGEGRGEGEDARTRIGETSRTDSTSPAPHPNPLPSGERGHGWTEREPAHLDSLAAILGRSPRPVHLLGEGIPFHEKFITREDASIIVTSSDLWRPRASIVARIGADMARRNEFVDPDRFTPIYIRRPEAEEKFDALVAHRPPQ